MGKLIPLFRLYSVTSISHLQGMDQYVTVEMVRDYIMDRTVDDNEIDFDLTFTDQEIVKAMSGAARAYNSLPPYLQNETDPARLDATTNMFLDAVVYQLYTSLISRLSRNDVDVSAGAVNVSINSKRIAHLTRLRQQHKEEFETAAVLKKRARNFRKLWGRIG